MRLLLQVGGWIRTIPTGLIFLDRGIEEAGNGKQRPERMVSQADRITMIGELRKKDLTPLCSSTRQQDS
jgi:hypothetical protein